MGPQRAIILIFLLTSLVIMTSVRGEDQGVFCGGTISFHFVDTSNPDMYTAKVTAITGWVLGKGPCGPSCSESDVGRSTKQSRSQVIQSVADPEVFGTWSKEFDTGHTSFDTNLTLQPITESVNKHIQGRVAAVSKVLQFEQEIAHFYVNISTAYQYTDIALGGKMWKNFDLNPYTRSFTSNIQTKVRPLIRNDTGKPNSSPVVLFRPVYRLNLHEVTKIHLPVSDDDQDWIRCRLAVMIEIDGIVQIPSITVSDDCVVTIPAMEVNGYHDNAWGMVGVAVEDTNRHPIHLQGHNGSRPAYYPEPLSISVVDFMVWVNENLTLPQFVSPTPQSQHVFTVYAGSSLSIPLAARPFNEHSKDIASFNLLTLPDHALSLSKHPVSDPARASDRVMMSLLTWRSTEGDTGDFLIQAVAVDAEGMESMDRSYKVHTSDFEVETENKTNSGDPYFPYFPRPGSIRCLQNATCSLPVFARPGTPWQTISSIAIVRDKTEIPDVMNGAVERVVYRGAQVYRADVTFTARDLGQKAVCFLATDNVGHSSERCLQVDLFPPNPCDAIPCSVSATCLANGTDFTCLCPPHKTGRLCGEYIDACTSNPCGSGGDCLSRYGLHFCICKPGYKAVNEHRLCVEINECESKPCLNEGTCEDKLGNFQCHCLYGFTGETCENDDIPVNKHVDTNKAHPIVPTPTNGLFLQCEIHTACIVPVYVKGGSHVSVDPGLHSPGLTSSTDGLRPASMPPGSHVTHLTILPTVFGLHNVCVDISDSGSVVDNVCYRVYSALHLTTPAGSQNDRERFKEGTLPSGAGIKCLEGVPCRIIVHTGVNSTGQCVGVESGVGFTVTTPVESNMNPGICDAYVVIDPSKTVGGEACIQNRKLPYVLGEKRCYTVSNISDANNKCYPNPCQNGGECVLTPTDKHPDHFACVCPPGVSDPLCELDSCTYHGVTYVQNQTWYDGCDFVCVCDDASRGMYSCRDRHRCQAIGSVPPGCSVVQNSSDPCCGQLDCSALTTHHNTPTTAHTTPTTAHNIPTTAPITPPSALTTGSAGCGEGGCVADTQCVQVGFNSFWLCPLHKDGPACRNDNIGKPVNQGVNETMSHAVLPSPANGYLIDCTVGHSCPIPVFLHVPPGHRATVNVGAKTLGISGTPTPLTPTPLLSHIQVLSLNVSPASPGTHKICLDVKDRASTDSVCFTVHAPVLDVP